MKKSLLTAFFCLLFLIALTRAAHAWIWADAIPPTLISGGTIPISQADINAAIAQALFQINSELWKFQKMDRLGRGFANAGLYASHAATQRNYQGYDTWALTVGTMAGLHAPAFEYSYYKNLPKKLRYMGDVTAGAMLLPYSVCVGFHLGKGFYLAPKFGMLTYKMYNYKVNGYNAGANFSYQIVKKVKAGYQVFVWRGLAVGTGFIYQNNSVEMKYKLFNKDSQISGPIYYSIRPQLAFNIRTETYTIPVEINTSIRLLWILNLSAGAGIDVAFGTSRIKAKAYTPIYVFDFTSALGLGTSNVIAPGLAWVYGEQKGKLGKWYFPKVMAGIGISIGPVVIDVPISYYFIKGFSLGVSAGIEW